MNFAGEIDASEIQHALHTVGVDVTLEEAARILQRSVISVFLFHIASGSDKSTSV